MSARELITEHLGLWTGAVKKKSSSGRGNNGKVELTGIKKLRELVLDLAARGKLVHQNSDEESAILLAEQIATKKLELLRTGAIKKYSNLPRIAPEDIPFDAPKSWHWIRLGELTEKIGSGATPRGGKNAYVESGIPFLRSQNILNGGIRLQDVAYIPPETHQRMSNTHVFPNDILLNITGASLGRCTVVPSDLETANVSQHVTIIRTIDPLNRRYLHYLMLSPYVQSLVWGRQVGMAREGLSKKVLEQFEIPLPPLEEQHRIVQKVDELMVLCDRLEQQTSDQLETHETLVDTLLGTLTQSENASQLANNWARLAVHFETLFTTELSIEKLKQTILHLAVMGRLVAQDAGDEPATEVLIRIKEGKSRLLQASNQRNAKPLSAITESEEPFLLPAGWTITRLDDITDIQGGIAKGKKISGKKTRTVPYLRVANVQRSSLDLSDVKEIEIAEKEVERYLVRQRDLLITEGGDWDKVGRTAIWDGRINPMAHQNHIFRARLILDEQNERWLERYLNSQFARDYFASSSKQTTNLASINKTQLRMCTVPLPPPEEQHRIVQKTDELMALCNQLKEYLNQAHRTRCQLAEAMLTYAFHGSSECANMI